VGQRRASKTAAVINSNVSSKALKNIYTLDRDKKHKTRIHFKYPPIGTMRKMTPEKRVIYINEKFQKDLVKIKAKLNGQEFKLIGTKKKPRGIEIEIDQRTLKSILKLPFVDNSLTDDKEITRQSKTKANSYFCFKVIFQIQIEGKKKGIQIEERFTLVKADNCDKAEAKVKNEFKSYEKPYLNTYGQLVRWKFDFIEESYHTFISDNADFDKPVEVFSKLRTRRLKRKDVWSGV
jgi:hypothetical protein